MSPNPTKKDPAGRGDLPSGRQAAEQPEHAGKENIAPESLHQGQGPDFQTQDENVRNKNEGIEDFTKSTSLPKGKRQKDAAKHEIKGGIENES
jgi:hypothetical protein